MNSLILAATLLGAGNGEAKTVHVHHTSVREVQYVNRPLLNRVRKARTRWVNRVRNRRRVRFIDRRPLRTVVSRVASGGS